AEVGARVIEAQTTRAEDPQLGLVGADEDLEDRVDREVRDGDAGLLAERFVSALGSHRDLPRGIDELIADQADGPAGFRGVAEISARLEPSADDAAVSHGARGHRRGLWGLRRLSVARAAGHGA